MNAPELITELRNKGYSIKVEGSYLDISPAENLSDELVQQLKKSKTDILCSLHQEKELRRLVKLVSDYHSFSRENLEEALETALGDQINALTCFSSLARQAGLI